LDQDHTDWKSWKQIACTISPTLSLFVARRPSTYSQENMGKFGRLELGWEKVACWRTKAAISLKGVKIEEKSTVPHGYVYGDSVSRDLVLTVISVL